MAEVLDYDRAAERIGRNLAVIAAVGTAILLAWRGWKWGAGFFVGSLISWVNYRWLRGVVESLGGKRQARHRTVVLAFRYLILGAAAYVILRFTSISLPAVLAGVFVLTAAVFAEAIFEIVYARK
jgi:hypothetical protein